jgi:hypothetical protein
MDNHHVSWVNQLFLWPFSIAFCMFTRPGKWISPKFWWSSPISYGRSGHRGDPAIGSVGANVCRSYGARGWSVGYTKWMWVKMEDLGGHRC